MFELYMLETCPYCRKVMDFMDENKINYKKNNILEAEHKSKLILLGGKDQVPYLYNPETKNGLYESDDIVEYLKYQDRIYEQQ